MGKTDGMSKMQGKDRDIAASTDDGDRHDFRDQVLHLRLLGSGEPGREPEA
jgi:hypothetical protein